MNTSEWALVVFTILAQMAVGSFVVLGVVHFFVTRKAGAEEADRMSDRALLAIGPVLVLGLMASFFHLGNPLNAYNAIGNLGSSWLSREILFGVLFAGVGFLFAIMQWRKLATASTRIAVAGVAAVIGVALVYSMARVYMLPNQPTWNSVTTPLSFFTTTLLLGALATGAAYAVNYTYLKVRGDKGLGVQSDLLRDALRWIAIVSVLLVGVQLVLVSASLINQASNEAVASVTQIAEDYGAIYILRIALVFIGAGVFAFFLYRYAATGTGKEEALAWLVYGAFALVLVAEVLGRYLFYATHFKIGL